MSTHIFSCKEARQIDMVAYLKKLGYTPQKINGKDYWYLSPLRDEKTASFKVNQAFNIWYDHGSGQGGNIIDFGILYHRLPISDLLHLLAQHHPCLTFSFQPPLPVTAGERKKQWDNRAKIVVVDTRQLTSQHLLSYLETRHIPIEIASQYCREVDFMLYGKRHTVIGFPNKSGGYELRNDYFKGSSSPKAPVFFNNGREIVTVFEGFFNFLSYLTLEQRNPFALTNFLVLNSLSFFQKAREQMEAHRKIMLFLDRDSAGMNCATQAIKSNPKYRDESMLYGQYKDLNDWLVQSGKRTG